MFMFNYFFLFKLKRTFYCWWVCLRPYFKKFKSLIVLFGTYIFVLCGGFIIYLIILEVVFWNEAFFSSTCNTHNYVGDEISYGWLQWCRCNKYSAAAEMPWNRKYSKDKFHYSFADPRRRRLVSRRIALGFDNFINNRRSKSLFNRIDALSRAKLKRFSNKHFPAMGNRLFFHLYSCKIPKNLYHHFPNLQKKPSGRFGGLKGFSVSHSKYIAKRPEVLNCYITYILPHNFRWDTFFWNRAIYGNNLSGYRILPIGVLPVEDGFFTSKGSRFAEFLKGSRVKVFDFRFFELSLLHPGLLVDKRSGSGMVVSFMHPAFYRVGRGVPVNNFFRDYIRQIKMTGLKDSVISLYLTLLFSDPDMFCYYLPRAIKFVFVDYSSAQAHFLRMNSHIFFPVKHWNRMYTVNNRNEPSVQLQAARSFIYRVARKQ